MGQLISALVPLRFRLWLGKKLFAPLPSCVVRVSWHRVVKGPCDPPEVEAMQYIAEHTIIPVPKVYAVHIWDQRIYIEMEYINGKDLENAWLDDSLTLDEKKTIFADIKQYVSILRELQPPKADLVSSALQNPAYDIRIGSRFFGPFNVRDFHSLTRGHLHMDDVEPYLGEEVMKVHTGSYRTCFTHGDLLPKNIIVRDGRVAAIIDWAFSGWYPEYWEFTKAHYGYFPREDWIEHVRQALPCYNVELIAEQSLWEKLPDQGTPATLYRDGFSREWPGSRPSAAWLNARAGRQLRDLWSVGLLSGHCDVEA